VVRPTGVGRRSGFVVGFGENGGTVVAFGHHRLELDGAAFGVFRLGVGVDIGDIDLLVALNLAQVRLGDVTNETTTGRPVVHQVEQSEEHPMVDLAFRSGDQVTADGTLLVGTRVGDGLCSVGILVVLVDLMLDRVAFLFVLEVLYEQITLVDPGVGAEELTLERAVVKTVTVGGTPDEDSVFLVIAEVEGGVRLLPVVVVGVGVGDTRGGQQTEYRREDDQLVSQGSFSWLLSFPALVHRRKRQQPLERYGRSRKVSVRTRRRGVVTSLSTKGTTMKILFTGATGALGRAAVPGLTRANHTVAAVSRTEEDRHWLERNGARPLEVDLFDPSSIEQAVVGCDTVIHFATAIPPMAKFSKRAAWSTNDRLRSEATRLLVDTALAGGVSRFIQQSITLPYADGGDKWLDEDSPIDPAWDVLQSALDAEAQVERFRRGGGVGVTLRLSRLYGPGEASQEYVEGIRNRKVPVVGQGDNYVSSIHVDDAASALAAALTAPDGVYNVTDDEPVTAAEYAGTLADLLGVTRPRRIPRLVARLALGEAATLLTTSHRVSNSRLRSTTGWAPKFPSVSDGWRDVVAKG
jgi:nucleoside-diphosphate-sugar epimerase